MSPTVFGTLKAVPRRSSGAAAMAKACSAGDFTEAASDQTARQAKNDSRACACTATAAPQYAAAHTVPQANSTFRGPTASVRRPPSKVPRIPMAAIAEKSWPTSDDVAAKTSDIMLGTNEILHAAPQ
mmetsp:Transcript_134961/g.269328  ORF Transcript_134961/g.269328 Transcript_134961/m.269328 type:complete len:127 (+) Transcript_134961:383-763(+)